ncbi:MAG: Zn-ribbon domain-containing OB-fold protein [Chloroflexota bacterium]
MSEKVTSQLAVKTVAPPVDGPDPWHAFRQVEIVQLELLQKYKHSLGKVSRFFIELEHQRFMATTCATCSGVFTPPRPTCPECLDITTWVELSGEGTLETYAVMHFSNGVNADVNTLEMPMVLAYVLMDGSTTLFPHLLKCDPDQVEIGMRVKVAYTDTPVSHPIHLMYFVPLEEA